MTRDPLALRIGALVTTPNGIGTVRARRCGPITTWLVLDFWWRESQIAVLEPRKTPTGPVWVPMSSRCEQGAHRECKGVCVDDEGTRGRCGCDCHEEPEARR